MGDIADLRALVVAAVGGLDGWTQSRFAPEMFGGDTDQLSHHAYAVGVTSTEPRDGRQSLSDGLLTNSTVDVQWAHRLRGDAQNSDYDAACDAEQDLVQAVVGVLSRHVLVQRLTRKAIPEGWVVGTATFTVLHRYALS